MPNCSIQFQWNVLNRNSFHIITDIEEKYKKISVEYKYINTISADLIFILCRAKRFHLRWVPNEQQRSKKKKQTVESEWWQTNVNEVKPEQSDNYCARRGPEIEEDLMCVQWA